MIFSRHFTEILLVHDSTIFCEVWSLIKRLKIFEKDTLEKFRPVKIKELWDFGENYTGEISVENINKYKVSESCVKILASN